MEIIKTKLEGVLILKNKKHIDERGYFEELWNKKNFNKENIFTNFLQDNHSLSLSRNTFRGLHCQKPPYEQIKLIQCLKGKILDIVVDFRYGSPTYGQSIIEELTEENYKQIFIPAGFLHGFLTLIDNTEIYYKCSDYYSPENEINVNIIDPYLNLDLGINLNDIIISKKDKNSPIFKDIYSPFSYIEK